jgi:2-methylcitrate dehydratase PrpD
VKPQIVEIVMRNGECLRQRIDYPKGNPKNPVTFAELLQSFRVMAGYAAPPMTHAKIDEAINFILQLETKENAAMMTRFLVA